MLSKIELLLKFAPQEDVPLIVSKTHWYDVFFKILCFAIAEN